MNNNHLSGGFVFLENRTLKARKPWHLYSCIFFNRIVTTSKSFQMLLPRNIPAFGIFYGSLMLEKIRRTTSPRWPSHSEYCFASFSHCLKKTSYRYWFHICLNFLLVFTLYLLYTYDIYSTIFCFWDLLINNSPQLNNSNQTNSIDYNDL